MGTPERSPPTETTAGGLPFAYQCAAYLASVTQNAMPVNSAADLSRVTTAAVNRIMQLWEGAGKCYVLIVARYTEKEQADGVRVIYNLDRPLCPVCGGSLSGYDRRRRVVLDDTGQPSTYLLRQIGRASCRERVSSPV